MSNKHTGFHKFKDGKRFNADCPACQEQELLLTPEEISNAKKGHTAVIEAQPTIYPQDWAVAKAQLAKVKEHNREVIDWLEKYAIHGGQEPLSNVLDDLKIHSPLVLNRDKTALHIIKGTEHTEEFTKHRDRPDSSELREVLAELEHEQWVQWASSIIKTESISKERAQRWQKLMVSYSQLTEEEKDQDRIWADKSLALMPDEKGYYQRYIEELVFQHGNELKIAKREEREKIKNFLWDYSRGKYNTENMNLEEQMYFKADKLITLMPDEKEIRKQTLERWIPAQIKVEKLIKEEAKRETLKEVGEEVMATIKESADYIEMHSNLEFMAAAWLRGITPTEALKSKEL